MKPFFQPDGLPEYESRQRHHRIWSEEWEVEQLLATTDDSPADVRPDPKSRDGQNPLYLAPEYDLEPAGFEVGSIRLLSFAVTGDPLRPTYILIMGDWDTDWSWFMPFSIFASPATNWELLSGMDPDPVQVLQVWNARSCPEEMLRQSWFVGVAPKSLAGDALALYSSMISGDENLPAGLCARVGTRVLDPNDPRVKYLEDENARLDYLTGLALQQDRVESEAPAENIVPFFTEIPKAQRPLTLAAASETPDAELEYHVWLVEGTPIEIHLLELLGSPGRFTLRVENDPDGLLEEAAVFSETEIPLGSISNGIVGTHDSPLVFMSRVIRIELADGQPVSLLYQPSSL